MYLTAGFFWNLIRWSKKSEPGNLSPPIAIPSTIPSAFLAMMFESSLNSPPDLVTSPQEPGLWSFDLTMFSRVPPAFPILKAPAAIPPTVAGPIIHLPSAFALAAISLASLSGIPSAVIAIVLIVGILRASLVTS